VKLRGCIRDIHDKMIDIVICAFIEQLMFINLKGSYLKGSFYQDWRVRYHAMLSVLPREST